MYILVFILYLFSFSQSSNFTFQTTLSSPHSAPIVSIVMSTDFTFFITGASQTNVKVWDTSTLTLTNTLPYLNAATNIKVNPSDNNIFVSLVDGTVSIVDPSTFTESTSYTYPNSGYSNSILFEQTMAIYYSSGFDSGSAPIVHVMDPARLTQNTFISTSFSVDQKILQMDLLYDPVNVYNLLAVVSDQIVSPFLAVFNLDLSTQMDFFQAGGPLNYVKFSPTGLYMFTTASDNIFRVYKLDTSRGIGYTFLTSYDTLIYGIPSVITSKSDSYVNVAAGMNILMFQIVNDQLQMIQAYAASTSSVISCLNEINSKLFVGFGDGSVDLISVSYSSSSSENSTNNDNDKIIIIAVVVPVFVIMLVVCFFIWFFMYRKKQDQKQQNQQTYDNNLNNSVNLINRAKNKNGTNVVSSDQFLTKNISSIQEFGQSSGNIIQIKSGQKKTHLKSSSDSHLQISDSLIMNDFKTIQFQQNNVSLQNSRNLKPQKLRPLQNTITIINLDQ